MAKPADMNPNLVGIVSVLVWGATLPVLKLLIAHFGMFAVMGASQTVAGALGLVRQKYFAGGLVSRSVFRNPWLYARWGCFAAHQILIFAASALVSKENISLVILLNYFWPTAIILFSVLFAGVKVTRRVSFVSGIVLVLASLAIEILQPGAVAAGMFAKETDVLAYVMAFTGAIAWGFYSMLSRKVGDVTGGGAVVPLFQLTLAPLLLVSFIPGMAAWGNLDLPFGLLLFGYCALQFVAYLCWDHGMRRGSVVFLSLCADFLPWISLAAAALLLGTHIGMKTVFSGVLLVAGAMITRYGTMANAKKDPGPYAEGEAA